MPRRPASAKARPRPAIFDAFEPALLRFRRDGWTPERQRQFIDALAESGCVGEVYRSVGMSAQSAYALRRTFEAQTFRLAWTRRCNMPSAALPVR